MFFFDFPYTDYSVKGEAWRLPGQLEYEGLPDTAKEAFYELTFEHLKTFGTKFFTIEIGRFDRSWRNRNSRELPTPLATFFAIQTLDCG